MEYCRSLKFEQEPNYRTCEGLFVDCMRRHNFDRNVYDYTWKQNRLSKDKEALKNSVLNVIRKQPRRQNASGAAAANGNGTTTNNQATNQ